MFFKTALFLLLLFCFGCAQTVAPLSVIGKWHTVKEGDTVEQVAAAYGASPEMIAELNDIPVAGRIKGRDQIFIPLKTGNPPGDGKPSKEVAKKISEPAAKTIADSENSSATVQGTCGEQERPCFAWPAEGTFSRAFGQDVDGDHDGIDIEASKGTKVFAAADGEVLYSGDAIKGYGNLVLMQHKDNIITVYAHNERNLVSEGSQIKQGEPIAEVGQSGAAKRPHLHFEVRVSEQPTDPLMYLPSRPNNKE